MHNTGPRVYIVFILANRANPDDEIMLHSGVSKLGLHSLSLFPGKYTFRYAKFLNIKLYYFLIHLDMSWALFTPNCKSIF